MEEVRDQRVSQGVVERLHVSGGAVHDVLLGLQFQLQGILYCRFTRVVLTMRRTRAAMNC